MADNSSTFIKRVISALLAVAVIFALGYFWGANGLIWVCLIASILAIREYSHMTFTHCQLPKAITWLFALTCTVLFACMFRYSDFILQYCLASVFFMVGGLWLARGRVNNENLMLGLALGIFGLLYCVVFPLFAIQLLRLDLGPQWFLFLMVIVCFGDTFAYFGGRWFGKYKLMPQVSPNKTWEGAASGLLGSSFAGVFYGCSAFEGATWAKTLLFCVVCGVIAQSGDLIMSLLKRVTHVKDSGTLMPGHGGILDRLDGIFIACPLVYAFARYVAKI